MTISSKLYDILLILSVLSLWVSIQIPEYLEFVVAYFLILSIGVGHGANDLRIYFKDQSLSKMGAFKFIIFYAIAVIIGFAAFFFIPDIVLALFIIVSGFHFGQEHFERFQLKKGILKSLLFASYGLLIVVALLHFNVDAALPIIHDIINATISKHLVEWMFYFLMVSTFILGYIVLKKKPVSLLLRELVYLAIIGTIFKTCPLIWGFAIYFIFWHSIPSIVNQIKHLEGNLSKAAVWSYMRSSILFWIAALFFLGGLYYFLHESQTLFLSIIVAFLGGITFPHVIVMNKLHK